MLIVQREVLKLEDSFCTWQPCGLVYYHPPFLYTVKLSFFYCYDLFWNIFLVKAPGCKQLRNEIIFNIPEQLAHESVMLLYSRRSQKIGKTFSSVRLTYRSVSEHWLSTTMLSSLSV